MAEFKEGDVISVNGARAVVKHALTAPGYKGWLAVRYADSGHNAEVHSSKCVKAADSHSARLHRALDAVLDRS